MLEREKSNYTKLINNLIYSENYDKAYKDLINDPYIDNGIYRIHLVISNAIKTIEIIDDKTSDTVIYIQSTFIEDYITKKKLIISISFGYLDSTALNFIFLTDDIKTHAYDQIIFKKYILLEIEDVFLINLLFIIIHEYECRITRQKLVYESINLNELKLNNFYSIFKIINEHVLKNSKV